MIGAKLKALRDERDWTQEVLAEKAGCARSYVSQVESGKREGSSFMHRKLAAALGCPLSELLGEGGELRASVQADTVRPMIKPAAAQRAKARPKKAGERPLARDSTAGKAVLEFHMLQDRRRQLVADLSVVDAKLETLLRVI